MLIGFAKEQLLLTSGGPKNSEMLFSLDVLSSDFNELKQQTLSNHSSDLNEGEFHQGPAELVTFIGQKQ